MEIIRFFFDDGLHFLGLCVVVILFGTFCCPLFKGEE